MKVSLIGLIACCAVGTSSFAAGPAASSARPRLADMPGNHPPQVVLADMPGNHPPQLSLTDLPGSHPPQVAALRPIV